MALGDRVRERRLAAKLTQAELAGERISKSMISQIENNRVTPSLNTLKYLAQRLHTTVEWLLTGSVDLRARQETAGSAEAIMRALLELSDATRELAAAVRAFHRVATAGGPPDRMRS